MQALMSVLGVRRAKAALSSGCKSHPETAPAGSNRSSHGGNEVAEAFDYPKRDAIQRTQGVVVASVRRTGWIEGQPSPYLG